MILVCIKCGKEKGAREFGHYKNGIRLLWCKTCGQAPRRLHTLATPKSQMRRSVPKKVAPAEPAKSTKSVEPVMSDTTPAPSNQIKILWLYRYIETYDFDNWLHLKFAEAIKQHPDVKLLVYGPEIHKGYRNLTTLQYNPKLTIDDIRKYFNFDVIILNTKSRMFFNYDPHRGIAQGEWVPSGFALVDVPRIVIEEDYHYETVDTWYQQNRIDLILQRHWSQSLRQQAVPMKWFPFSVDTNTFQPGTMLLNNLRVPSKRHNKICFAGSINNVAYKPRYTAAENLKKEHMIDMFSNGAKHGASYIKCLQDYVCHLSCSSIYKLSPAKMFEIMASGSALLTNENDDLPLLFPAGSYFTYKTDGSNVVEVGRRILSETDMRNGAIRAGMEAIRTRHSHQVRIEELLNIIRSLKK